MTGDYLVRFCCLSMFISIQLYLLLRLDTDLKVSDTSARFRLFVDSLEQRLYLSARTSRRQVPLSRFGSSVQSS